MRFDEDGRRTLGRIFYGTAFVALLLASLPWLSCTWVGPGEAAAAESGAANADEAPVEAAGLVARLQQQAPACYEQHPLGRQRGAMTVFWIALLGGFFVPRLVPRAEGGVDPEELEAATRRARERQWGGINEAPAAPHQVEAIELDEDLDLGLSSGDEGDGLDLDLDDAAKDSLYAFMQEEQERRVVEGEDEAESVTLDGFFCPPGLSGCPILYVDASCVEQRDVDDEARINSRERPFAQLDAALAYASKLSLARRTRVQVRLMPGVYQVSLDIPGQVSVINHRLPARTTSEQRQAWLRSQKAVDHPERVTILAPASAEYAVRFAPGQAQGLFGCHIVGREGVQQVGIRASGNVAVMVAHCSIEGFAGGGIQISESGEKTPGREFRLMGCRIHSNTAPRGGALSAIRSAVHVEQCQFENNKAAVGGALYGRELPAPMVVRRCQFERNRAHAARRPEGPVTHLKLGVWQKSEGLGGAVAVDRARLKLVDCKLEGNNASFAGGAICALASQIILQADTEGACTFSENHAAVGGALAVVGWTAAQATTKSKGVVFKDNVADRMGGAIVAIGLAAIQVDGGNVESNRCVEADAAGGAVACLKGGDFRARNLRVYGNRAQGAGGAITAINGSIRLASGCLLAHNIAEGGDGGGIYAVTVFDPDMDLLVSQFGFDLPFVVAVGEDCALEYNIAQGPGGGIRAGNDDPRATFPLTVRLTTPEKIWSNRTRQSEMKEAHDLWVFWAGQA